MEIKSRRTGHIVGYCSIGCSIAAAVKFVNTLSTSLEPSGQRTYGRKHGRHQPVAEHKGRDLFFFGLSSALSLGTGIWLLTKLYMKDPEALKEYRAKMETSPLKDCLKFFSNLETVLDVLEHDAKPLRMKIEHEVTSTTLDKEMSLCVFTAMYGDVFLKDTAKYNLYTAHELRSFLNADVVSCQTFSQLWKKGLADHHDCFRALNLTPVGECKLLFLKEFDWVHPHTNEYQASAPSAAEIFGVPQQKGNVSSDNKPGAEYGGVFGAIANFGDFAEKEFGLSCAFFEKLLEGSTEAEKASFEELNGGTHNNFLVTLRTRNHIGKKFCDAKFLPIATDPSVSLWEADSRLKIKTLLKHHVVSEGLIGYIFNRSIPMRPSAVSNALDSAEAEKDCLGFFTNAGNAKSHIIPFMKAWGTTIKNHPGVIDPTYLTPIEEALQDHDVLIIQHRNDKAKAVLLQEKAALQLAKCVAKHATEAATSGTTSRKEKQLNKREQELLEREAKLEKEKADLLRLEANRRYVDGMNKIQKQFAEKCELVALRHQQQHQQYQQPTAAHAHRVSAVCGAYVEYAPL